MSAGTRAHTVQPAQGHVADLGIIHMRLLAAAEQTGRSFTLAEFSGGEGPWTVPHIHRAMEESFYVLEGNFIFKVGDETIQAGRGAYILVPRGTPHMLEAGPGDGKFLTFMVPGGLEDMFLELAKLPPDSLRNPEVRAAIAARYDSVPA